MASNVLSGDPCPVLAARLELAPAGVRQREGEGLAQVNGIGRTERVVGHVGRVSGSAANDGAERALGARRACANQDAAKSLTQFLRLIIIWRRDYSGARHVCNNVFPIPGPGSQGRVVVSQENSLPLRVSAALIAAAAMFGAASVGGWAWDRLERHRGPLTVSQSGLGLQIVNRATADRIHPEHALGSS
jgi:hypothetical protein